MPLAVVDAKEELCAVLEHALKLLHQILGDETQRRSDPSRDSSQRDRATHVII